MPGHPGHITQPYDRLPVTYMGMDAWMTSQPGNTFYLQATWFIDVPGLFSDMLPIGVCTTVHWHTYGRLVQELNVCTVDDRGLKVQVKSAFPPGNSH